MSSQHRVISAAVEAVFRLGKEAAEKDRVIKDLGVAIANAETWKGDACRRLDKYATLFAQEQEKTSALQAVVADFEKTIDSQLRELVARDNLVSEIKAGVRELDKLAKSQRALIATRDEDVKVALRDIGTLKDERDALSATVRRHEDSIVELSNTLLLAAKNVEPMEAELKSLQDKADALQREQQALRKANEEYHLLSERRKETIRAQYEASIEKDKVIRDLKEEMEKLREGFTIKSGKVRKYSSVLADIAQYTGDDYEKLISIASNALKVEKQS